MLKIASTIVLAGAAAVAGSFAFAQDTKNLAGSIEVDGQLARAGGTQSAAFTATALELRASLHPSV